MGIKNVFGGKKARTEGLQFEYILKARALFEGVHVTHHQTSSRAVKNKQGKLIFIAARSGYDFTLSFDNGLNAFIDCKSFDSDRITYSQITQHQVEELFAKEEKGNIAGFIIWLRKTNSVCFVWASELKELNEGESIKEIQMHKLGVWDNFRLGLLRDLNYEKRKT